MMITIKYFGLIAEITGCQEENITISGNSMTHLLALLNSKYPNLKNKNFQIAQNKALVSFRSKLTGEDIALLPPFAGG